MKTTFPLFARLLLWLFANFLFLVGGLALMIRIQFGSLDNLLLSQSVQDQIQALSAVLVGDLAHSDRAEWDAKLAALSGANKMSFALFDGDSERLAGAALVLPEKVRHSLRFAASARNPFPQEPGPGMTPPWRPPSPNPPPDGLAPPGPPDGPPPDAPPGGQHREPRNVPAFPKSVIETAEGYWLLVRLPPEPLGLSGGAVTLVGMTPSLGTSPLLFDPKPWFAVAIGVILFSILFWFPLAHNLTSTIARLTRATESIAEGRFEVRLAESRRDELGRLAFAINRMAGRLKNFVTGQKRFLGDAAHELCSPLVRMEMALGILEDKCEEGSLDLVRDIRDEVAHMRELVNELLNFSKASLGESTVRLEPVDLADVAQAALVREAGPGAPEITIDIPAGLEVLGSAKLLGRAVGNLVRNAILYAGEGGPIAVAAWREGSAVILAVTDSGPGVPKADLERLFDPFYRVDRARTAETGGVGLGLAIVKSCVESCQGSVTAVNREPSGLEVRLRLKPAG